MSFWFRRKDAQGHTHYFSVSAPLLVIVAVIGILVTLLSSLVGWLLGFAH